MRVLVVGGSRELLPIYPGFGFCIACLDETGFVEMMSYMKGTCESVLYNTV